MKSSKIFFKNLQTDEVGIEVTSGKQLRHLSFDLVSSFSLRSRGLRYEVSTPVLLLGTT